MFRFIFITIINLLLFYGIFCESDDTIAIRIKSGIINGKRDSFDGTNLNIFLGIPYAKPPIGELRFRKPQPLDSWTTPIEAKQWPNACIHQKIHQDYFNDSVSEDCLYLNIWSPSDITRNYVLKPVLFWIHGGSLFYGSSVERFYSGQVLAAKGDIVVVTFNYRLNIFGFLYTGTDSAPGNMGLWDQVLALEWVNDNIRYFGGDPNRITIAGENAGSISVSLHILSPVTRNLFQNAILMSGSLVTKGNFYSNNFLIRQFRQYAEVNGCSDDKSPIDSYPSKLFTSKIINCLKNLSAEQLESTFDPHMSSVLSMIVIDGQYLPHSPMEMMANNEFKKKFNLFLGTVEDEGSWVLPYGIQNGMPFHKNSPPQIDYNEAISWLNEIVKHFVTDLTDNYEEAARLYFSGLANNTESDILRRRVGIAIGDFLLGCPTILFGKTLYRKSPNIKVYQYYFNSRAGKDTLYCAKWMGVCHFDYIYPLFGLPFSDHHNYKDIERLVSKQMIEMFSEFVRSGRPSSSSLAEWQSFYTIDDNIIAPFYEITSKPKSNSNFGIGLKETECEYLWSKFLF